MINSLTNYQVALWGWGGSVIQHYCKMKKQDSISLGERVFMDFCCAQSLQVVVVVVVVDGRGQPQEMLTF